MTSANDLKQLSDSITESRKNFVIHEVNDTCVRLAVNHQEYPWHYHPNSDELFVVLEGELTVVFLDKKPVVLKPNHSLLVLSGVVHKTCPKGRTVNLCVEKTGTETVFLKDLE